MIILLIVIILTIILVTLDQQRLITRNYVINSDKIEKDVRIVQVTDLHNIEFGKDNINLVDKIKFLNPDIICVTGDMINDHEYDYSKIITLLNQLTQITDVYYSLGNNEVQHERSEEIIADIEKTGAVLLIDKQTTINVNGNQIEVFGNNEYITDDKEDTRLNGDLPRDSELYTPEAVRVKLWNRMDNFLDSDNFKLLLCHYPERFDYKYNEFEVDLMLAGHAHGGAVRLPFLGGLIAPDQGYFPKYELGYFQEGNANMIISAGLGSHYWFTPRINNPPEITVIDLM